MTVISPNGVRFLDFQIFSKHFSEFNLCNTFSVIILL
jgi:hypothetical protein